MIRSASWKLQAEDVGERSDEEHRLAVLGEGDQPADLGRARPWRRRRPGRRRRIRMRMPADERAQALPSFSSRASRAFSSPSAAAGSSSPHPQRTPDDLVAGGREVGDGSPREGLAAGDGPCRLPVAAGDDLRERRLVESGRVDEERGGDLDRLLPDQPPYRVRNHRAAGEGRGGRAPRLDVGLAEERFEEAGELPEFLPCRVRQALEIGDRRHEHRIEPPLPVGTFEITEAIVHAHTHSDTPDTGLRRKVDKNR